ncbi:hypothetical protein MATL_G00182410 [Megalops atlanticus]|uniref:RETREG1-3/ARL6IP-like N-terminal reticulon-homology domain-containing protein n=1 Tax=Megalops atlanticus TaxID=7932 RepID=A0A9D3T2G8_MEGAT|nr:hypothetical protein MATL_G00182410 [Megalops atlanticus]
MASGEEAGHHSVSSSSVGLEALFPAEENDQAGADGNPELQRLQERLQGWLSQYEPVIYTVQRLLVWERPLHSICVALALNTAFWLLSSTSLRPIFLMSVSILGLLLLERWKHKLPNLSVQGPASVTERESEAGRPRLLSVPELSHHLAESYLTCKLYLQEVLQYKRLNHGKFCLLMCAGCLVLAVVGHYVPGIMISYIILLSVLLWPLVVYHELIQKMYTGLEPILMKLDYSMKGDAQPHKKKVKKESEEGGEPQVETESESEEELSCFAPTVDVKTTALAMAITDSELSDEEASILESGGFSVSRATTPQLTDFSEDLDRQSVSSEQEETVSTDLKEFPSVDEFPIEQSLLHFPVRLPSQGEGTTTDPLGQEQQSPASLLIQQLASPLHFVNTHFNGHGQPPGAAGPAKEAPQSHSLSLEALSEEIVSTAISTVVQNTRSALLRCREAGEGGAIAESRPAGPQTAPPTETQPQHEHPEGGATEMPTDTPTDTPTPVDTPTPAEEDFELLDQSELEKVDKVPGPGSEERETDSTDPAQTTPSSQCAEES